jgi:hypothetical protein
LQKILLKGFAILAIVIMSLGVMALVIFFFQDQYKKQLWDPRTAALVNGVPILREAVEDVLRVGSNPPLSAETETDGSISISLILEKLIEEELVRQAAAQEGVTVSEEEVADFLENIRRSWGCVGEDNDSFRCQLPKGRELDSLSVAIRQRILVIRMAELATARKAKRSKAAWDSYLADWTKKRSLPAVFKARAVLTDKTEETYKLLTKKTKNPPSFEDLIERLKDGGAAYILSDSLYLDPSKAEKGIFQGQNLPLALKIASESPNRLSEVLVLPESYAVIEILDVIPPSSPQELAYAARGSYENSVSDKAFKDFIDEIRAKSVIEINPNFPELVSKSYAERKEAEPKAEPKAEPEPEPEPNPEPETEAKAETEALAKEM